tara:strand:- start:4392 stop:6032 length:1641 start_codon:yes stop_codon:yes gene_type:complete
MGRFVGSSINKGSGGGGGGSGTIVQTDTFTRATGITTDSNNNVTSITVGDEGNKYTGIKYNAVGLITAYNETISDNTKGFALQYDSQNLVTSITEVAEWTYVNVTPASGTINEGTTVAINVDTNSADGTFYWDTDSDADITTNSGSFAVAGGTGTFNITTENDLTTEGAETLSIRVYSDSVGGTLVGTGSLTISDTSLAPLVSGYLFHVDGYNTQKVHSWTVPAGVTSISVVCVGGGGSGESNHDGASGGGGGLAYKNNITVTPGETVIVRVGGGGFATSNQTDCPDGQTSSCSVGGVTYAVANGGRGGDGNQSGNNWYDNSNSFPNTNSDGGGMGGAGFHGSGFRSGGGGAGGYQGSGNTSSGRGCNRGNYSNPQNGNGGGGGGGCGSNGSSAYYSGGGGGTGVYGQASNGTSGDANGNSSPDSSTDYAGKGGSTAYTTGLRGYCVEESNSTFAYGSDLGNGYNRSTQASFHGSSHTTPDGGFPGGGGGGSNSGSSAGCGGHGVVRIVVGLVSGSARTFPQTNVDVSTQYTNGVAETEIGTQLMY